MQSGCNQTNAPGGDGDLRHQVAIRDGQCLLGRWRTIVELSMNLYMVQMAIVRGRRESRFPVGSGTCQLQGQEVSPEDFPCSGL